MQNDYKYVAQVASTMAMEGMKLSGCRTAQADASRPQMP